MIDSLPNRTSISPFRKSVSFSSTIDTNNEEPNKKKHHSLKIITGNNTDISPNSSISSPSRVRQRLTSLFRSSSPVVTTLKGSFSHSSSNLSTSNKRGSQSAVSLAALAEQIEPLQLDQQQIPTLMEPLQNNYSSTTLSSSSDTSSDHMPASPADGAAANTFNQHRKEIMDPSFWNPITKNNTTFNAPPPTLPTHQLPVLTSLACQVQKILANTLDEIDKEIDLDWEKSRNALRQSLILPNTPERIRF
jgi:hypothetical protein